MLARALLVCLVSITGGAFALAQAQPHLSPPHGANGVPGIVPRSFVIEWGAVSGAVAYEYVLSDNPLCFAGCPGDTRQAKLTSRRATEFNLQENTWYYWITRVYLSGQAEPTVWTGITSFLANAPDPLRSLVVFAPNPTAGEIGLYVDWAVVPNARYVLVSIYDVYGRLVHTGIQIDRADGRFQRLAFGSQLPPGVYLGSYIVDGNPNNPNNTGMSSIVVL
jgi:hypothetical protein